ncbi:hypothetical protein SEA_JUANYO_56 [Microbacterium phage Juanyo]|nr:hypothetical protein SEA_JUANYO_56 [Microbacterium phage Juanyo]
MKLSWGGGCETFTPGYKLKSLSKSTTSREAIMARTVLIGVNDNQGYAPDQINTDVTLADLLSVVAFTKDAKVVVSNGQRYGAGFGSLEAYYGGEVVISDAAPDDEDDDPYL